MAVPIGAPARVGARSVAVRGVPAWLTAEWAIEAMPVTAIMVLAFVVRLPNLGAIPVFTDEVEEIGLALAILREGVRPLTNVDAYIGPLWNYLLAALFAVVSPSLLVPRAVAMTAGVATVLLTYALGRAIAGPRVAMVAALVMAASAVHSAVNSHVAWSNCITPLFTTFGLWLFALALRLDRPSLLPWVGASLGLAVHTHPTAGVVAVAVGAMTLLVHRGWLRPVPLFEDRRPVRPRGWLRTPWPYMALYAAILMNLNMIVYNVATGGRTLTYSREIQRDYVREAGRREAYSERLADLAFNVPRVVTGPLENQGRLRTYLANPIFWLGVLAVVGGLAVALWRRAWLPVFGIGAAVALLPLVNPKYDPILNGRYLAPILPLLAVCIGLMVDVLFQIHRSWVGGGSRWIGAMAGAIVLSALCVAPIAQLGMYYANIRENFRTGDRIMETVRVAKELGPAAHPVVIDERLDKTALGPGAGIVLNALRVGLELEGVSTRVEWLARDRPEGTRPGQLVILASRQKPNFTADAVEDLGLLSPFGRPAHVQGQASLYGLYSFGP